MARAQRRNVGVRRAVIQRACVRYRMAVGVAVAAYHILNPRHAAVFAPERTWAVLHILMMIAAVPALVFNTCRKLRTGIVRRHTLPTRQYWECNIAFAPPLA